MTTSRYRVETALGDGVPGEMGVVDHVLESISGHLSRRMLEHSSHIRIDAKRQALDARDEADRRNRSGDSSRHPKTREEA